MSKKYEILIRIPEDWIDVESPIMFASHSIYDMARREVHSAIVKQYLEKIKVPKLKISAKEIKQAVIEEIARRQVDKMEGKE